MTLGDIIDRLKELPENLDLHYEDGIKPETFNSYRGYYHHLALSNDGTTIPVKVKHFLTLAEHTVGATFQGYKGGDYTMKRSTPVWRADYGNPSSIAILRIDDDGTIQTAYIGDYV